MPASVRSFKDYEAWIKQLVARADSAARLRFCEWVLKRFPEQHGEVVWDGLSPADRARFVAIVILLGAAATRGERIPPDEAAALLTESERFGPEDEVARTEVEPKALQLLWALELALQYQRTGDPTYVEDLSLRLVESLDAYDPSEGSFSLTTMFTHAALQREIELHAQVLGSPLLA